MKPFGGWMLVMAEKSANTTELLFKIGKRVAFVLFIFYYRLKIEKG